MPMLGAGMQRVGVYIDGFNLYFGLKARQWKRYYWLNVVRLAENLLRPNQCLGFVKYFTARISGPPEKRMRQEQYLDALATLQNLKILYGHYMPTPSTCRHCGVSDSVPKEKMTDVNIAVEILVDAYQNAFDLALIISGDGDLVPPVRAIRRLFPAKVVVVAFPPRRASVQLGTSAHAHFMIGRAVIAKSLLPEGVAAPGGFVLKCPPEWVPISESRA